MWRVLRNGEIDRLRRPVETDPAVRFAAWLVRSNRELLHRSGGFGVLRKRGQKLPEGAAEALRLLANRRGWLVDRKALGSGPYAGESWRVVWLGSKVLRAELARRFR